MRAGTADVVCGSPGVAMGANTTHGRFRPSCTLPPMRAVVGVAVAAMASAAGAVIIGEYDMVGFTAFLIAVLFGVAIAEVLASIARTDALELAASCALLTQAGLVWGLWIETGHHYDRAPAEAWVALVVGAAASAAWFRSAGRRGQRTPSET